MPTHDVKTLLTHDEKLESVANQLAVVNDAIAGLRREVRAELDRFALELEAIEQLLFERDPGMRARFPRVLDRVRQEVDPEARDH